MVNFTEKDEEYINNTKGVFSARGIKDTIDIFEKKVGKEGVDKIVEEMKNKGYDFELVLSGKMQTVPVKFFVAFLVIAQKLFNLTDNEMKELGTEGGKLSFLLRFASKLLISVDILYKNADVGWKKYYKDGGGDLCGVELDKENKRTVLELRDFVGHPAHCLYIEGYIEQLVFLVTGKKAKCKEDGCVFKGDNVHRFTVTWE